MDVRDPFRKLTLFALEVGLLHEMRDARRHAVDVVERLDAALDNRILTVSTQSAHSTTLPNTKSNRQQETHLGFSCFTILPPFLPCFRSFFCSATAPTLAIEANSFNSANPAS